MDRNNLVIMRRFDNFIEVTALRTDTPVLVNVDSIISAETSDIKWCNKTYTILYLQGHNVSIKENVSDIAHLLQVTKYP